MNLAYILKTKKVFFLFAVVAFSVFSISPCHILPVKAVSLEHDLVQGDQTSHDDDYHSSVPCHYGKENLARQENNSTVLLASNRAETQNQQRFILNIDSKISQKSFGLARQRDDPLVSSENFSSSQAPQLLTVVKLE